jgi:hypothetical protein
MARKEGRYIAQRTAYLSSAATARHQVVIRDISKNGVCVVSEEGKVCLGEVVSLDFGEGDIKSGSIMWISENKVGIMLER